MNLTVENLDNKELGKLFRSLLEHWSSIGAEAVIQNGQAAKFVISTIPKPSDERQAKSDKSDASPQPESQPLTLQLQLRLLDNGVGIHVFSVGPTGALAEEVFAFLRWGEGRSLFRTFTVSTSPRPTSTESTYSKAELSTLLKRRSLERSRLMSVQEYAAVQNFIEKL